MEDTPDTLSQPERQWAMFLHFSLLAGFLIPFGGLVIPILIWQMKKGEFPSIDAHGKVVVNWLISAAIYGFVFFILSFVLIGMPLLIALGFCSVAFAIIGGIKANDGVLWRYPGTITFIS